MDSARLKMLHEIQELEFFAIELNLFLDTHPSEEEPLREYNHVTQRLANRKKVYEERYGPLTPYGTVPSQYPWQWVDEPWPWEIEY